MKKVMLSIALVAAMVLGTTAYAQTPTKKEVKKEQTATVKKEAKQEKASCTKKAEKSASTATPAPKTNKKK